MDYKAFVSSTFIDLEHHRERVIDELQKAGFFVDPMEHWASAAQEPKVLSTRRLDGCKLCVLLVARRRGHVPEGDTLSITQQEVAEAKRRGIDILTFLLDDGVSESDWPWDATDRPVVEAWRKDLREHHVISKFKADPATIELGPALTRWVKEQGAQVALDLYLKLVEQEHGTIQFVGLPQLKDNPNVPIKRLYVEPALAEQQVSPNMDPKEWPATAYVLEVMAEESKLVVLGDPGSGKSTLVNWIAWQLAKHHHSGTSAWTLGLGRLVPLPIILRNLDIAHLRNPKTDKHVTWEMLLRAFLDQPIAGPLDMAELRTILEEGRALIMLDGLDEIGNPAARRDLRDAVWDGMHLFGKCRWLLTSRIVGYEEVPFDDKPNDYDVVPAPFLVPPTAVCVASVRYVAPFDDARVEQFADNWFLSREKSEQVGRRLAKELVEAVRADDSTTKLGRIPNLLTMMALIYRIEAQLPHGRARLYAKIAQAYLETIDKWRKIQRTTEEWADRRRWLARVGFEMQRRRTVKSQYGRGNKEILASGEEVRGWIAAAMAESGKVVGEHDAAEFVEYLAKRSGLLLPRGQDQFAFLHLSFQEYFAASLLMEQVVSPDWRDGVTEGIADGARTGDVRRYANESLWQETLVFLVELMAVEQHKWLKTLRACLFGADLSQVAIPVFTVLGRNVLGRLALRVLRIFVGEAAGIDVRSRLGIIDENQNRVVLLARLAVDPQSGFDSMERERAVRACCRWEIVAQQITAWKQRIDRRDHECLHLNRITQILLEVNQSERHAMIASLVQTAQDFKAARLDLSDSGVNSLPALAGLSGLAELDLSATRISDLSPLAGLSKLLWLNLEVTGVKDLSPLSGLSGLRVLRLFGTGVSDLSPLAGLKNLREIWLGKDQQVTIPPSLQEIARRL